MTGQLLYGGFLANAILHRYAVSVSVNVNENGSCGVLQDVSSSTKNACSVQNLSAVKCGMTHLKLLQTF